MQNRAQTPSSFIPGLVVPTRPRQAESLDPELHPQDPRQHVRDVPVWMASLEKAAVFLKRLFRHHITVPDGRAAPVLTWPLSLRNTLDERVLQGCFA